jgi:hypothetical protein
LDHLGTRRSRGGKGSMRCIAESPGRLGKNDGTLLGNLSEVGSGKGRGALRLRSTSFEERPGGLEKKGGKTEGEQLGR